MEKVYTFFFQDIIDVDSDPEDTSFVPSSSKINQRSVCLLHECNVCLIFGWQLAELKGLIDYQIFRKVITLLREFI